MLAPEHACPRLLFSTPTMLQQSRSKKQEDKLPAHIVYWHTIDIWMAIEGQKLGLSWQLVRSVDIYYDTAMLQLALAMNALHFSQHLCMCSHAMMEQHCQLIARIMRRCLTGSSFE